MDSLQPELLLEIFDRLNDDSLKNASQVCARWSALIKQSPILMKRFTLYIDVANNQSFCVSGKIVNGNCQNIVIRDSFEIDELFSEFYEYLAKHKTTADNITLQNFMFNNLISTINVFDLENITNLTLMNCDLDTDKTTLIEIPNLRNLQLFNSIEFLKCMKIHKVKMLKISNHGNYRRVLEPIITEHLNSFLLTCDRLKEFTLSNFNNRSTPLTLKIDEFKFNLVSLTVECSIINNLKLFLLSQRNSLENLAINSEDQDVELMKTIFYELTLKELEIDVENVPQYFPSITRNATIKKLILMHCHVSANIRRPRRAAQNRNQMHHHEHEQQQNQFEVRPLIRNQQISFEKAEKIISICSAVGEISIYDFNLTTYDFLIPIYTSMPNLKVLKLSTVPSVISPIIQFNNLTTHIEIDEIYDQHQLVNLFYLVIYSPRLRVIKINKITAELMNENHFTKIIHKAKNLEEFYIGSDFVLTSEINNAVRHVRNSGYPLRKLMYTKSSHDKQALYDESNIKIQNFKYSLCDQPELFFTPMENKFKLGRMERNAIERESMLNESKCNDLSADIILFVENFDF